MAFRDRQHDRDAYSQFWVSFQTWLDLAKLQHDAAYLGIGQ